MIVPYDSIAPDTLNQLIKDFVLRDLDVDANDIPIEEKCNSVLSQLKAKKAVIVYSELHESVNIIPTDSYSGIDKAIN